MFGKQTEIAIAAMSYLAELDGREENAATAAQIAQARSHPRPFVAKVMGALAQRGLVTGTQGRKGGYVLALPPAKITLWDIASCFERNLRTLQCPFGPSYCGKSAPCPLHREISRLNNENLAFLERTTLAAFCARAPKAPRG